MKTMTFHLDFQREYLKTFGYKLSNKELFELERKIKEEDDIQDIKTKLPKGMIILLSPRITKETDDEIPGFRMFVADLEKDIHLAFINDDNELITYKVGTVYNENFEHLFF